MQVRAIIDFLSPHGFPEVLKVPFWPIEILPATRTSDNVFLKAYYEFHITKIRLITKRILNPNNVFINQN
jgi:hypothetical protein